MPYFLNFAIVILIVLAQCTDVFAYSVKGMQGGHGRQAIGLASLLNFTSRVFYMSAIVSISILFEVYHVRGPLVTAVASAFVAASIFNLILMRWPTAIRAYQVFFLPLYLLSYRELRNVIPRIQPSRLVLNRSVVLSFVVSFILGSAYVIPVWIATHYPELRMVASYSGQVLNFFATALALALLEPILYRQLDNVSDARTGVVSQVAVDIIYGKMASQLILAAACIVIL